MSKGKFMYNGEEWNTFLFEYVFEEKRYDFTIVARSKEEAERRIQAMQWATLLGDNCKIIPANAFTNIYVRLLCWWRKFIIGGSK